MTSHLVCCLCKWFPDSCCAPLPKKSSANVVVGSRVGLRRKGKRSKPNFQNLNGINTVGCEIVIKRWVSFLLPVCPANTPPSSGESTRKKVCTPFSRVLASTLKNPPQMGRVSLLPNCPSDFSGFGLVTRTGWWPNPLQSMRSITTNPPTGEQSLKPTNSRMFNFHPLPEEELKTEPHKLPWTSMGEHGRKGAGSKGGTFIAHLFSRLLQRHYFVFSFIVCVG